MLQGITTALLAIAHTELPFRSVGEIARKSFSNPKLQARTHQARVHSDSQPFRLRRLLPARNSHALRPVRLYDPGESLQHILAFVGIFRGRLEARIVPRAISVGIYVKEA